MLEVARLTAHVEDGFYAEEEVQPVDGPKQKQRVIQKIPEKVIQNAKGLAIFTTMRTGLWLSGAGGSGILIARQSDGSWSPPSGIMLHTAGLGFLAGVDIYDCVVVINNEKALDAFTKVRCTLGGEISAVAGPLGAGALLETEVHKRQAPIYTYFKSRGFYAGVQIDGTIVVERFDENERFYGEKLPVAEILAGKVRHPPLEIKRLIETIRSAQGDTDVDESALPTEAPPGDYEIDDGHVMSVPDKDDPDPYGVLALEKEGMSLKEAGSQKRASWEQFAFNPAPSSPIYNIYSRQSQDTNTRSASRRSSWRSSAFGGVEPKTSSSLRTSMDQRRSLVVMTDTSTQTDLLPEGPVSPSRRSVTSRHSHHSSRGSIPNSYAMQGVPENEVLQTERERPLSDTNQLNVSTANGYSTPPHTPPLASGAHRDTAESDADADNEEDDEHDEHFDDVQIIDQPVVHSVQTIQPTAQPVSKARIVNVPKRLPPKLPPRSSRRVPKADPGMITAGSAAGTSQELPQSTAVEDLSPASDVKSDTIHMHDNEPTDKQANELLEELSLPPKEASVQTGDGKTSPANETLASKMQNVALDEEDAKPTSADNMGKSESPTWRNTAIVGDTTKERMPGGFE